MKNYWKKLHVISTFLSTIASKSTHGEVVIFFISAVWYPVYITSLTASVSHC